MREPVVLDAAGVDGSADGAVPGRQVPGHEGPELVWYVAYGSNMHDARLRAYLRGGRVPGGARTYPGCRDSSEPRGSVAVVLPGELYFATWSPVWDGGRAFYDPEGSGRVWARAHLVTAGQFGDILAQEMYRDPGADADLREAWRHGRESLGPGRYETLVCPGTVDGVPAMTFTAPWRAAEVERTAPSAAYLRHLAAGLTQAEAWEPADIARYLARRAGADGGGWSAEAVRALMARHEPDPGPSRA